MAQSRHAQCADECPLLGAKRTVTNRRLPISIYEYTAWSRLLPLLPVPTGETTTQKTGLRSWRDAAPRTPSSALDKPPVRSIRTGVRIPPLRHALLIYKAFLFSGYKCGFKANAWPSAWGRCFHSRQARCQHLARASSSAALLS
jgi:hypothetical protein